MMVYLGQPVPTTSYQQARAKVSDGKSVRVSVPASSGDVVAGNFYYFGGFLGVAMQNLANNTAKAQDLILQIEQAVYETDQVLATDTLAVGTRIFWDDTNKRFTETATSIYAGIVTAAKDDNNVIWFLLTPGVLGDEAMTAIGTLTDLDTTEKDSIVGAVNEVNTNVGGLEGFLKNCVQTGVLVGAPTTASTHADAGAFDFNVDITPGIVVVNGVLAEIAKTVDFDVAHDTESPIDATDTGIVYAIVAAEADGTVTLAAVTGAAAAEPEAPTDEAITTAVGHKNWVRIATTKVVRTGAATITQTYDNSVRPSL
jgi:hypothetical protein